MNIARKSKKRGKKDREASSREGMDGEKRKEGIAIYMYMYMYFYISTW